MLKITTVLAVVISFIACEDEFETIGTGVIGEPGFTSEVYSDAEISATNIDLGPVQTNNLPVNLLGVYKDPVFGTQEASILTQLALSGTDPDFGDEPVLDSVVMTIPYFSREVQSEDGTSVFELDSVYGNGSFKLTVRETNYFLNEFDPETNFEQSQKYYSNLDERIEQNLTSNVLYENDNFTPSSARIVEYPIDEQGNRDTVSSGPALRVKLDNMFFQDKILNMGGSSELTNQNDFRNYFRSLYIKAEDNSTDGSMALLNLANADGGITLYYHVQVEDSNDEDGDGDITELVEDPRSYTLNFDGTRVNTFDQDVPEFNDDENIYLKGGEGAMAIIDLFSGLDADSDGVSDELEFLRDSNWLINEANIVFYVNRDFMTGVNEPERIYLYDLTNNIILADYNLDPRGQLNSLSSDSNRNHLVPLERDADGNGVSYKVRVTGHINNLINNGATNVRLGLVVTQNVNLVASSAVLESLGGASNLEMIPAGSLITPEATVLYGPNAEDAEKRLKLNIYYTEPKN